MSEPAQEMWYSQTIHTYKPYWLSWVHGYNYEAHFECLDILMLGKSPIKWRPLLLVYKPRKALSITRTVTIKVDQIRDFIDEKHYQLLLNHHNRKFTNENRFEFLDKTVFLKMKK